jgi:DNA-binding NarL/FixJ family response regulator
VADTRIRVLVVDDHAVVREGLRTFLSLQDGIEVVGEAGDGREAVAVAERERPDVVLMDLMMPRLDGVQAMRELRGGGGGGGGGCRHRVP